MRIKKSLRQIIGLGCLLGMVACARVEHPKEESYVHQEKLQHLCQRYGADCQFDTATAVVTLSKGQRRARGLIGSSVVMMGDEKIVLSMPLTEDNGDVLLPSDFKRRVMDRLIEAQVYSRSRIRQIIIDAGHGGKDPGAISHSGTEEKTVVLDISKRLKRNLEDRGINVVMIRDSDEFISLERRTEIASQLKADLFVSIHANSSKARSAKGMEVYYLRDLAASEKKEDQRIQNQETFSRQYRMEHKDPVLREIVAEMMYDYKKEESEKLAHFVNRKTVSVAGTKTRGCKSAGFYVLRNTMIPAILVEVGFISNPSEERLLKSSDYRQKLADGLAQSIIDYVKH